MYQVSNIRNKLRIDIALLLWNIFDSPRLADNIIVYRMVPKFVIKEIISSETPWEEKGFMSVNLLSIAILIR